MGRTASFKRVRATLIAPATAALAGAAIAITAAEAGGWATVHRYVKPSGACAGQEVLASYY
jgi:hypothetical protein